MHSKALFGQSIIPYQELPGNYNFSPAWGFVALIIPYQELPGNYNGCSYRPAPEWIIPYQELPGNYNGDGRRRAGIHIIPYQELPEHYHSRTALESSPSSRPYHLFVIINHSVLTINRDNHLFPAGRNADERNVLFSVFKSATPNAAPLLDTGRKRA